MNVYDIFFGKKEDGTPYTASDIAGSSEPSWMDDFVKTVNSAEAVEVAYLEGLFKKS